MPTPPITNSSPVPRVHTAPVIRLATRADLPVVVETLADGFHGGDYADWLIPDPAVRAAAYPAYFRIIAEHAIDTGFVELTDDGHAVALWHMISTSLADEPPIPRYARRLADAVGLRALPRFVALDTAFEERHPPGPHHYLGHLAVRPQCRGQGLGGALLAHHHTYLDEHGISAHLEATSARNQRLYRRHGYDPRPGYDLTSGGPRALPMWRDPQPVCT